jgi:hypothetical protein
MATKAKATAIVDAMSEAQLIAVDAVLEENPAAPVADVLAAMVAGLTAEVDAEMTPEEKEKAAAIKAACERQLKLSQLSTPAMESAMTAGILADRAARRSWEFVGDRMLIAGFVSSDLDTPTKECPATVEYLAIRDAVIRYGYPQKEEGTERLIIQEAIKAPARQRVVYNADIRSIVKNAVEEEIPRFLRSIKAAMKKSEDRGPRSAALTIREQMHRDIDAWLTALRIADEKKLDFDVVEVVGALKDVKNILDGLAD